MINILPVQELESDTGKDWQGKTILFLISIIDQNMVIQGLGGIFRIHQKFYSHFLISIFLS